MKRHGIDIHQLFEDTSSPKIISAARRKRSLSSSSIMAAPTAPSILALHKTNPTSSNQFNSGNLKKAKIRLSNAGHDILSPDTTIKKFGDILTPYEMEEIRKYSKIYCIGTYAKKIGLSKDVSSKNNYDYDDNHNFYRIVPNDHICYRYEIADRPLLGRGTFGQVIKAFDVKEKMHVAIKIVRNEKEYLKQSREEIRILHLLKKHDIDGTYNIVSVKEFFMFRNHMVITFELLGMNLYQALKLNSYRGLQMPKVKAVAKAILKSLELLFKLRTIHCDLKPENILFRRNGDFSSVKLADFGSSCHEQSQKYHYIQSRFYRAPEVILGLRYGPAIDMWSLGCVLGELAKGTPILMGDDEFDQLASIEEVFGSTPAYMLNRRKSRPPLKRGRGQPGSKSLNVVLPGDDVFKDVITWMLELNPEVRPTPFEIQDHQWFGVSKQSTNKTPHTSHPPSAIKKT